jgi:putative restriction endonuclease
VRRIFDTKPTSIYDDDISSHYHFPRRYLSIVEQAVGDWVVLRRPRADGGNLAYFATARVTGIDPDPEQRGMSYARLADYLTFDRPVPWTLEGRYWEEALRATPQAQVGVFLRGRSVRALGDADFTDITTIGFSETFSMAGHIVPTTDDTAPPDERVKRVVQGLVTRIVRDANFRASVYAAYDHRCAITGLRMLDSQHFSLVRALPTRLPLYDSKST